MKNKYTEEQIQFIIQEKSKPNGLSSRKIAKELGISKSGVNDCWNRVKGLVDSVEENDAPKVLLFDIETSMLLGYFFSIFKPMIPLNFIKEDWYVLCWSARWLGESEIMNASLHHFDPIEEVGRYKFNERYVVEALWKLLDDAHVVVAYNGKKFDRKKMNTKFLEYGLPEPSPYKIVDPYWTVRNNFAMTSNKMDFVARYVQDREQEFKHGTGGQLWVDCMNDDLPSLEYMQKYCDQDIEVLEKVYLLTRSWDKTHPNMALYYSDDVVRCNVCGSDDLESVEGKTDNTNVSSFQLVKCNNCQANLSERVNKLSKEKRKSLLRKVRS